MPVMLWMSTIAMDVEQTGVSPVAVLRSSALPVHITYRTTVSSSLCTHASRLDASARVRVSTFATPTNLLVCGGEDVIAAEDDAECDDG